MYWAIVTMTTVGYGDIVPHTTAGKFISATLDLARVQLDHCSQWVRDGGVDGGRIPTSRRERNLLSSVPRDRPRRGGKLLSPVW